jgi:hypothetical protein
MDYEIVEELYDYRLYISFELLFYNQNISNDPQVLLHKFYMIHQA